MKKFNWKKIVAPIAMLVIGLLGGLLGAFILLTAAGVSFTNSTDTGVKTAKTVYNNTTDTTKAVKKVQNAVVSVINYQEGSSSDSLNELYGRIFGGDDSSDSSQDKSKDSDGLQVAGEGSGVIYKKDGKEAYIVTNNHVVDGAKKLEIMLSDGSKITGELVGKDTYSDLAVVKVSSDKIKTVAEFADSNSLTVGEKAIAIGSPLGTEYANSVTEGIVSSLSRTVTMQNDNGETVSTNAIQTDAAINPGNSGGALVNIEGQVIGINSSKISSTSAVAGSAVEGMGFAIPSNDVVEIINQLEKDGKVALEQRENSGLWGGLYCFPQFADKEELLAYLTANGIRQYQPWPAFRHTFSHFHLEIYPIYARVDDITASSEANRSSWIKVAEKENPNESALLSAVKYWYDPQNLGSIGLATPVKNLLTQYVRNRYGKNGIL